VCGRRSACDPIALGPHVRRHASIAPVLLVAHSCVLSWWRAVKGEEAPPSWNVYRRRVGRGLAGAGLVVAPTRAMRDALIDCHGPLPATRVIWNARDPQRFAAGGKEPFVLAAGRLWDEAKNLRALAACSASLPWPVYVAGSMQHPDARAAEPGDRSGSEPATGGGLRHLGPLAPPDMARWLARASIYALPARYEPFGLSVLEAALAGCALVLGDIASLRELWSDAAVLVPPGDPDALGRALSALAGDEARRRALAVRARARARGFSPDRMVQQYLSAYEEIICGGVQAPA
jgi:glycogen synthase